MVATLKIETRLKKISDAEIMEGLKYTSDQRELKLYENEFYSRYVSYVFKVAMGVCRNFRGSEDLARDVTQETFIKAFAAVKKFKLTEDPRSSASKIKAWLGKIANNVFLKLYPQLVNTQFDIESLQLKEPSYEIFEDMFDPVEEIHLSEYAILFNDAMNLLKEIDKHIILTYAEENCLNSTQHLSDSAMKILCETYKTTSDNIRQRKHRAYKKIKTFCLKI